MLPIFKERLRRLEQRIVLVAKSAALFSGWLYLFTALFITSDVITRKFFGFSSKATDEFSIYALGAASALSMAYTLKAKNHVRVEVMLVKFPKVLQGYLNLLGLIGLLFVLGLLVFHMWILTWDSFEFSSRSSTVYHTPLAWPQLVWVAGYTLFFILALVMIVDGILEVLGGRASALAEKLGPLSVEEQVSEALQVAGAKLPGQG